MLDYEKEADVVLLMAMVLILGVASPSFAAGMPGGEEVELLTTVTTMLQNILLRTMKFHRQKNIR